MKRPSSEKALERARSLGHFSTEAEKRLWSELRGRRLSGAEFRRQVWLGDYIPDVYCAEAKRVVEADGGQHDAQSGYDDDRAAWLEREGFRVIRFWNDDVLGDLEGVCAMIVQALTLPPASGRRAPPFLLQGEGN